MRIGKQPEFTPVTDLQEMLREIYPDTLLSKDGIFGDETEKEVRRFQRDSALEPTGEADAETWQALVAAYETARILNGESEPLLLLLQPRQILRKGEKNTNLYVIQGILFALSRYYDEMPIASVTGILDRETSDAIEWFQKRADLPTTGELDKLTWRHLAKNYRSVVGDGTGSYPIRIPK